MIAFLQNPSLCANHDRNDRNLRGSASFPLRFQKESECLAQSSPNFRQAHKSRDDHRSNAQEQ